MNKFEDLVALIKEKKLDLDIDKITAAYILAQESHVGQKRRSGEDYIIHPVEVAEILVNMKMDTTTIIAGILHDVVEDTLITLADIKYTFGDEVMYLVDGVTKLRNLPKTDIKKIENIRKMVIAMSDDIRVVVIKLADRLHNMRTLDHMTREKQIEKSKETLDIFAPIAHRIGMSKIKSELEDISFRYLHPVEYDEIKSLVNEIKNEREEYTDNIIKILKEELDKENIKNTITGRPKHLYSIYKKMYEKGKRFDNLYDLIAIRILVENEIDCYHAMGIVHKIFEPHQDRIKDYIARPKPNGYQSIHTTLIGPDDQNVEVQIRTYKMHEIAEDGVAAHWKYKEKLKKSKNQEIYNAAKKSIENSENSFVRQITGDVLKQTIFVFTPKGDVIELIKDSTPLDFAFHIHTQIGYKTIGAKVNDKIVPLDYELKNGDTIDILTSKNNKGPGGNWINIVKTHSAKIKIRRWFKEKEFDEKVKEGEELIERALSKLNLKIKDIEEDERLFLYLKKFSLPDMQTLFYKIAVGDLSLEGFIKRFVKEEEINLNDILEETAAKTENREKSNAGIKISGTDNTMFRFAKCCTPLPGDDIVGYVSTGRGIIIHREDCTNLINLLGNDNGRKVEVYWDEEMLHKGNNRYEFFFTVKTLDRPNILMELIKVLNDAKIELSNVNTVNIKENGINYSNIRMGIFIKDKEEFNKLANNMLSKKDVISILRK